MKFIFLFLFSTSALAQINITASDRMQYLDYSGENGSHGRDGKNAYVLDCHDYPGVIVDGVDGNDGEAGEDGGNGESVILNFSDIEKLRNLALDLSGGLGGLGGRGGRGSPGCNGGEPGETGSAGKPGLNGTYGKIFFNKAGDEIPQINSTRILNVMELVEQDVSLSYNQWTKVEGVREFLHPSSDVEDAFYLFDRRVEKKIKLNWAEHIDPFTLIDTSIALHLDQNGFHLNVYSGAFLRYSVVEEENQVLIFIDQVVGKESFANLKLGKMRKEGTNLTLEVRKKFFLPLDLKTSFAVTLYQVDENTFQEKLIGHFPINLRFVLFDGEKFHLYIGKLNYPSRFKRKGVKLKVFLSVYREAESQRRSYVLKGTYRI